MSTAISTTHETCAVILRCATCQARWLARMTYGQAERQYEAGRITQAMWEAYGYVWSEGKIGRSDLRNIDTTDPAVAAGVEALRAELAARPVVAPAGWLSV